MECLHLIRGKRIIYVLLIINHMSSIASRYLPKSDKLNFVDLLVIQNHARSKKVRIEIEH